MFRKFTWLGLPIVLGLLCYVVFIEDFGLRAMTGQKAVVEENGKADNAETDHESHPLEESYCCCTLDEISRGTEGVTDLLNNITSRPFFRFFKVNLEKPCPYWAVQLLCTSEENSCQVCSCDANEVPEALKYPHDMSDPSVIDSRVSYAIPKPTNVDMWGIWRESDDAATYVDLVQNPEGNTGYSGPMAGRVWQAIYNENCMTYGSQEGGSSGDEECKEEQVFRKLISGLHTSITMHVAAFFHKDKEGKSPLRQLGVLKNPNISFFPNCGMYSRVVNNAGFVNNLYVLYQFVLRALTKAKEVFLSDVNAFNSGAGGVATAEDKLLHTEIRELFNAHLLCSATFNEAKFLESPKAHNLIPQMKRMVYNITKLMDCVTCEKCRAWGKLQTMGIATALKIVMLPPSEVLELGRGEKVSLVNLARQLAVSVKNVRILADVCRQLDKEEKV
ncbi:endoplasmic reticulum oxidoreductin [Trypanosoma grayi]|uniref:endoplasmic reticulum oxidoreductin n=1 Tax=Trypanosoma grayi TaxID=71804 RepID=UPI0004F48116|nr:endoplasmic reticulum oxidoreductin [Trypanosoma grayi]KEG09724.1 endoplasmic reticulum oxidoreductin [Trypanosoma grayi]